MAPTIPASLLTSEARGGVVIQTSRIRCNCLVEAVNQKAADVRSTKYEIRNPETKKHKIAPVNSEQWNLDKVSLEIPVLPTHSETVREMLRRALGNENSLPTHGRGGPGGSGFSTSGTTNGYYGSSGGISDEPKYKKGGRSDVNIVVLGIVAIFVVNLCLTVLWMNARGNLRYIFEELEVEDAKRAVVKLEAINRDLTSTKRRIEREWTDKERKEARYQDRIQQLEVENDSLTQHRDELRNRHESAEKKAAEARYKYREVAFSEQMEALQKGIRKESRRQVLEQFGPGPHQVEITIAHESNEYAFVIEMAPLHTVPHATHLFLEQVDHGLWNTARFYINTGRMVQAGPVPDRESAGMSKDANDEQRMSVESFRDLELDTLAFPDYSPEYPHRQWTVGFASRPGGPDFYINTDDNVEMNGPMGQAQQALEEQADSCFGQIIPGQEHIQNILLKQPTFNDGEDWNDFFREQIVIVKAVILTKRPDPSIPINMEIAEPEEIVFGRALNEALTSRGQSQIDDAPPVTTTDQGETGQSSVDDEGMQRLEDFVNWNKK